MQMHLRLRRFTACRPRQVLPVTVPAQSKGERGQLFPADPAVVEGYFLGYCDALVLPLLDVLHERSRLHEAVVGPGVEPREPPPQPLDVQLPPLQVAVVDVGDLQLPARARPEVGGDRHDVVVVEVEPRHRPARTRAGGLLFDGGGVPVIVDGDDSEAFGVVYLVREDGGAPTPGPRASQLLRQAVSMEDVVAERERARVGADELPADQERLGDAVRARLHGMVKRKAPPAPVAEELPEVWAGPGRRDHQDVPDPGQHQYAQRVVDQRLVVHRQELLAHRARHGVEPRAFAPGENDALHADFSL